MNEMTSQASGPGPRKAAGLFKKRYFIWTAVLIVGVLGLRWLLSGGGVSPEQDTPTFTVRRSDLRISVLEGGNLKAINSQEIKSDVEGSTTIIYLIPEGTKITEKDIDRNDPTKGTLLVELDSSAIKERLKSQEITFQSANSDYIMAKEALEIQKKQNDSDITAGELAVKFALLDLQKYLGKELADDMIGLSTSERSKMLLSAIEAAGKEGDPAKEGSIWLRIRGASLQQKQDLENAIRLADEELTRAENDLQWTTKLEARGFVSKNDLEADTIARNRRRVEKEQSETTLDLFMKYDFYKETEKLLSDYEEAKKQLDRTIARARAMEAQKVSTLEASKAKYELQKDRLDEYRQQVENCRIYASTPGLVVWSNGGGDFRRESQRIEEGATVRQRQSIITIPDTSTMAVSVKVHETSVDRVRVGQRALITIDALPGETFEGKVLKIAVLPDSQSRWLNPDLKVYSTDVSVAGSHDFLKPGMSAQVEIVVKEFKSVLIVPIQAVGTRGEKHYCLRVSGGEKQAVPVVTGDYNDTFIEIRKGLEAGDVVLVNPSSHDWKILSPGRNGSGGHQALRGGGGPPPETGNQRAFRTNPGPGAGAVDPRKVKGSKMHPGMRPDQRPPERKKGKK